MHYQDFPLKGIRRLHIIQLIKNDIVSEINKTKELPEGTFPITLKLIHQYQRK